MKKNKLKKLVPVSMALMLTFGMATTAFAGDWTTYQGNDNHNGVVTNSPITSSVNVGTISLLNANSGWDGVDNVPVMQTVNGTTYAYVLYDGHADKARLAKIKCNDSTKVWDVQVGDDGGFQLSTPLLVQGADSNSESDDAIYAAVQVSDGSKIVKVANLDNATTPSVQDFKTGIAGQINTPVTKYGNFIYFGTWIGNGTIDGENAPGKYYQVNASNAGDTQSMPSINHGFYWAGAVAANGNLYFGGDGGYLYHRPMGAGFGTTTTQQVYDSAVTLPAVASNEAGDVRSTACLNDGKLYFTSKGTGSNGNLYCYSIGTNGTPSLIWGAKLAGTCTSTPTVADSGMIYVGYYQGFSAGGVQAVTAPESGTVGTAVTINPNIPDPENANNPWSEPVQCSPLVKTTVEGDYIYCNTNSGKGAGYCFLYDGSTSKIWSTAPNTYALGGMACNNGYIVFGNDYNKLFIVH